MSVKVGELYHELRLDDRNFNRGMNNAESNASKLAGTLKKGLANAAKIGAAGIATTSAVLIKATKDTMNYADEIDKTSQRMGLNYEQTQKWNYVAEQMGTNLKSLERGLGRFQKNVNDAAEGTGSAADAIEGLGIDVTDANGNLKDMNTLFPETVKKMQGMENITKRNAVAMDLFGRGGKELIPILNSTEGNIDDLMQKAEDLGIVMDETAIKQGVEFTDTMNHLSQAFDGLKREIGQEMIPVLQGFANYILANLPKIRKQFFKLIESAKGLIDNFMAVARTGKLVYSVLKFAFDAVADVIVQAVLSVQTLVNAYKFLSNSVELSMKGIQLFVAEMVNANIKQIGRLRNVPGMGWAGDMADSSQSAVKGIKDDITGLKGEMDNNISDIATNARSIAIAFGESGERTKENLDQILRDFDAFGNDVDSIFDSLKVEGDQVVDFELGEGVEAGVSESGTGGESEEVKAEKEKQKSITEIIKDNYDKRMSLEQQHLSRLIESRASEIEMMELEKRREIEAAKEAGASTWAIEQYWNEKIKNAKEEKAQAEIEAEREKENKIRELRQQSFKEEQELAKSKMSRLIEQNATQKEMLQLRMKRELEEAKGNETAIYAIKKYYNNKINELEKEQNQESIDRFKERFRFIKTGFENAFESILQGTKSVTEAFGNLWNSILDQVMSKLAEMAASKVFSFITGGGGGGILGGLGSMFGGIFHDGGVVPGPIGQERLILAQAGEHVSPIGSGRSAGGGGYKSANIYLNIDGRQVAQSTKQHLADTVRVHGGARY